MSHSMPQADRLSRLNSVDRPKPATANLSINRVDTAARILRLAISRSGVQHKTLGDDKGRIARLIAGTEKDRLWFHDMLDWPPEIWKELLVLIALEVCAEKYEVIHDLTIREKRA